MAEIIQLHENDSYELNLILKSLLSLRTCYPNFKQWYTNKILKNLDTSRKIFLARNSEGFSGVLILKNTSSEKKICTLFVNENNRFKHLGSDLIRIASEELETYKLSISVNDEVKDMFFNASSFNFYTKEIKHDCYSKGKSEYFGYIMYHNPDKILYYMKD